MDGALYCLRLSRSLSLRFVAMGLEILKTCSCEKTSCGSSLDADAHMQKMRQLKIRADYSDGCRDDFDFTQMLTAATATVCFCKCKKIADVKRSIWVVCSDACNDAWQWTGAVVRT